MSIYLCGFIWCGAKKIKINDLRWVGLSMVAVIYLCLQTGLQSSKWKIPIPLPLNSRKIFSQLWVGKSLQHKHTKRETTNT